jgi:hypothetical protein
VHRGTNITDGATTMAEIDWPTAITALDIGDLPWATPSPDSTTAASNSR